ncbi:MAG TPA: chemotaxis protein CheW [Rectinemataceae bacterium]|nr:chemotaxis protein CheW [Rectinemataceae bacterium]
MTDRAAETKAGSMSRPLVVFSLDERRYALALERVRRSIRAVAVTPLPEAPAIVLGIVDLGGTVFPVIDLRKRFNLPPRDIRLSDQLLIADTGRRGVALLVDATMGLIEAPSERYTAAGEIMSGLGIVAGVLVLEDGMILIHDLELLLSFEEESAVGRALSAAQRQDDASAG